MDPFLLACEPGTAAQTDLPIIEFDIVAYRLAIDNNDIYHYNLENVQPVSE